MREGERQRCACLNLQHGRCNSTGFSTLGRGVGGQLGPIRADPLLPQPLDRASHGDEVVQQVSPTSYLSV